MTLPHERRNAITSACRFLEALLDPKKTPKVPDIIRQEARRILKHFPSGPIFDYHYKEIEQSDSTQEDHREAIKEKDQSRS